MSAQEEYYGEGANGEEAGQTGPGAPTPLTKLEVRSDCSDANLEIQRIKLITNGTIDFRA